MDRRQQALLIAKWQAPAPECIAFIEQGQFRFAAGFVQAIEHLDALWAAHGQDQREVVAIEGMAVQMQRAVKLLLGAEVLQQCWQITQSSVADLSGCQLQHVVMLTYLHQIA